MLTGYRYRRDRGRDRKPVQCSRRPRRSLTSTSSTSPRPGSGTWSARLDDLEALERFPTQESIRTSVELIEGLTPLPRRREGPRPVRPGRALLQAGRDSGHTPAGRSRRHRFALRQSLRSRRRHLGTVWPAACAKRTRRLLELVRVLRAGPASHHDRGHRGLPQAVELPSSTGWLIPTASPASTTAAIGNRSWSATWSSTSAIAIRSRSSCSTSTT